MLSQGVVLSRTKDVLSLSVEQRWDGSLLLNMLLLPVKSLLNNSNIKGFYLP